MSKIAIGIESTAHTAGVGLITSEGEILSNQRALYVPEEGGIHPREAANHHSEKLPDLFRDALQEANLTPEDISLVSYARGPGLGPCLRTGATAARAFAYSNDIPLLGVNHCVAHLEIGLLEGATDPVFGPKTMMSLSRIIHSSPKPLIIEDGGHFLQEWGEDIAIKAMKSFLT